MEEQKSLRAITVAELAAEFEKLKEGGLLFRASFAQLSKHLLKEFLPVNPFAVDFATLAAAYRDHIGFDSEAAPADEHELFAGIRQERTDRLLAVMQDETAFHQYICKEYFDLVQEPRQALLAAYERAASDLTEIDATLADITQQMSEMHKRNDTAETQNEKPLLYYFQRHNEQARSEILAFLKEDIHAYALSQSYDHSLLSGLMQRKPYLYQWRAASYKPHPPSDLSNKFDNLPLPDHIDLRELYANDKPAFYAFLTRYIQQQEIVFSIGNLVPHNHVLHARREIILETLQVYEHGAKIVFALAVPSIVEGILHELCLLTGAKENDLLADGFQAKLDYLQPYLGWELYYEYYAFRFRLIRNKVSHGRLTKTDVDELADLLLLDLFQVCRLTQSNQLEVNHKRFVVDELNKNLAQPDFNYLLQYLLLSKVELPAYYQLDAQVANVEQLIGSDNFWRFLEAEIDRGGEHVQHGILIILQKLSARRPFDPRCTRLFKKLGFSKADRAVADQYLKYLTRDY